MSEVVGMK